MTETELLIEDIKAEIECLQRILAHTRPSDKPEWVLLRITQHKRDMLYRKEGRTNDTQPEAH